MNEILTIIFSKNRACQLELLLRNFNMPATVLYTYDNEFKLGYEKLIKMYSDINFIKEVDFKKQLTEIVKNNKEEYVMFLVDDDVMLKHFNEECEEFNRFKNNKNILCLSLRMSLLYNNAPEMIENTWEWRKCKKDWGYPMAATSHIFRKQDILSVINNCKYDIPNILERKLRQNIPNRLLMLCFDKPKIINIPANQVQIQCPSKNAGVSLIKLEQKFLSGKLLSLSDIKEKAKESKSCFLMTNYKWEN